MTPALVHIRRADPASAHRALRSLIHEVCGVASTRLVHACSQCGSSAHGRPTMLTPTGPVPVSLSRPRNGGPAVVAVCPSAPVGIDVEAWGDTAFEDIEAVALHPREHCLSDADRARLWVRKEALLKAHGTGLVTDPRKVRLGDDGTVLEGPLGTIADVDAGEGWVCAVAVASSGPLQVRWS